MGCSGGTIVMSSMAQIGASCSDNVGYSYGSSCSSSVYSSCSNSVMASMGSGSCMGSYAAAGGCGQPTQQMLDQQEADALLDGLEYKVDFAGDLFDAGMAAEEVIKTLKTETKDILAKLEQIKTNMDSDQVKLLEELTNDIAAISDLSTGSGDSIKVASQQVEVLEIQPDVIDLDAYESLETETTVSEPISSLVLSLENLSDAVVEEENDDFVMENDGLIDLSALIDELSEITADAVA